MHRRQFIKNTTLFSSAILISSSLVYCSDKKFALEDNIGKSGNILDEFPVEGDSDFSYYILQKSQFSHSEVSGQQAFVFCKNEKIIGYTIKIDGTDKAENYLRQLSQKYGVQKKVFENDFGHEYSWENNDKQISLTYAKNYANVPQYTYFSEAILDTSLFIF